MSFYIPQFDSVDESGRNMPDPGRHDVTLTKFEPKETRSGRDMMVVEMTIDRGKDAGHTIAEHIVFGVKGLIGEARLKRICNACGFGWRQYPTLREFVAQFPEGKLRASVLVDHQYSVQKDDDSWDNVPKAVFDTYEGKKNIRAVVADDPENDYRPAEAPPALAVHADTVAIAGEVKYVGGDTANLPFNEPVVGFGPGEEPPF